MSKLCYNNVRIICVIYSILNMALHLPDNLKEEEIFWRYHFFFFFLRQKNSVSIFMDRNKVKRPISYLWKVNFRRLYPLLLFQQVLMIIKNIHVVLGIIEMKLLFIFRSWSRGSYSGAQHLSFLWDYAQNNTDFIILKLPHSIYENNIKATK